MKCLKFLFIMIMCLSKFSLGKDIIKLPSSNLKINQNSLIKKSNTVSNENIDNIIKIKYDLEVISADLNDIKQFLSNPLPLDVDESNIINYI